MRLCALCGGVTYHDSGVSSTPLDGRSKLRWFSCNRQPHVFHETRTSCDAKYPVLSPLAGGLGLGVRDKLLVHALYTTMMMDHSNTNTPSRGGVNYVRTGLRASFYLPLLFFEDACIVDRTSSTSRSEWSAVLELSPDRSCAYFAPILVYSSSEDVSVSMAELVCRLIAGQCFRTNTPLVAKLKIFSQFYPTQKLTHDLNFAPGSALSHCCVPLTWKVLTPQSRTYCAVQSTYPLSKANKNCRCDLTPKGVF